MADHRFTSASSTFCHSCRRLILAPNLTPAFVNLDRHPEAPATDVGFIYPTSVFETPKSATADLGGGPRRMAPRSVHVAILRGSLRSRLRMTDRGHYLLPLA